MADILLFSTADWDHPVWTNKQHVACTLNQLGFRVLYVESVGLRPIRRNSSDRRRLLRRLLTAVRPPRQVRPGLWCWSPLVLPGATAPWALRLNRVLFSLGLKLALLSTRFHPSVIWTYNPMTLAYYRPRLNARLLYHCVDDIQSQPDMNAEVLTSWESRLCHLADVVYTTSPALRDSRVVWNINTYFLPNVADSSHFGKALEADLSVAPDILDLPSPRIGFVGSISAYKLNFELIAQLAKLRPNWSWILIGPVGEGEGHTDLSSLLNKKNIHLLGPRPYQDLPSYMKGLDVALLPLQKNAYTHSMFPMKFFEYLASGLPVVATDIASLHDYRSLARLVQPNPGCFLDAIESALHESQLQATKVKLNQAATHFSYHSRTLTMLAGLGVMSP